MEAAIREKDDLRCYTTVSGEPSVQMDSITQQQESFAACLDSGTSEDPLAITIDMGRFG